MSEGALIVGSEAEEPLACNLYKHTTLIKNVDLDYLPSILNTQKYTHHFLIIMVTGNLIQNHQYSLFIHSNRKTTATRTPVTERSQANIHESCGYLWHDQ